MSSGSFHEGGGLPVREISQVPTTSRRYKGKGPTFAVKVVEPAANSQSVQTSREVQEMKD